MHTLGSFVPLRNIDHFIDQLALEQDPGKQKTLRTLLIEEEDKFGEACERLVLLERHIIDGKARITKLMNTPAPSDRSAARRDSLLQCMRETLALLEAQQRWIEALLNEPN